MTGNGEGESSREMQLNLAVPTASDRIISPGLTTFIGGKEIYIGPVQRREGTFWGPDGEVRYLMRKTKAEVPISLVQADWAGTWRNSKGKGGVWKPLGKLDNLKRREKGFRCALWAKVRYRAINPEEYLPYNCAPCFMQFNSNKEWVKHKRTTHWGGKLHCPYCQALYLWDHQLSEHIKESYAEGGCTRPRIMVMPYTYRKLDMRGIGGYARVLE